MPAFTICKTAENGQLLMVELQGKVQSDGPDLGGQALGELVDGPVFACL